METGKGLSKGNFKIYKQLISELKKRYKEKKVNKTEYINECEIIFEMCFSNVTKDKYNLA